MNVYEVKFKNDQGRDVSSIVSAHNEQEAESFARAIHPTAGLMAEIRKGVDLSDNVRSFSTK